jgi:hypothetical protein
MIRRWTSSRSISRWLCRGAACGLTAGVFIGLSAASSSIALSFEPSDPHPGGQPAQTGQDGAPSGKSRPNQKKAHPKGQPGAQPEGAGRAGMALPERPPRTVTPSKLSSADLDQLIAAHLRKNDPKVEPATLTTDVEFVRRIYFDLIGRPPTPQQVQMFLLDRTKDKRARLIDVLLNTPEHARNWAKYWRDVILFHATNENLARVRFDALEDWLTKQFQANTPWDQIVSGMITASGRSDENGAVALWLAHEVRPVELAGEVSRIFMGVQIQCAQCHDHKTDSWKRVQFHEFAAFFTGMRSRPAAKAAPGQPPVIEVIAQGPRLYSMPDQADPKKSIPIAPRFFLSSSKSTTAPALPKALPVAERRALAASYITGQDNPWFARAYINRIWYALMGEAFYEPIDDLGPERSPNAPEVIDPLADQWQKGGYDIRWLFRTIVNTQAYQRRVRSTANAAGKTPFASSCPSRLRADQVFDALVQALALPVDANGNLPMPANPKGALVKNALKGFAGKRPGALKRLANQPQAKVGPAQKAAIAAGLASQITKKATPRDAGARVLFDRLFGVDPSVANEDVVGTIPQALFLMNSPMIDNRVQARPGTVLGEILSTAPSERAALGALYLRVLSRLPTRQEVEICDRYVSGLGNTREAFEDIYWSLINSTEFLSRR